MDLEKIKQLIEVLAASDLDEMELVEGAHRVRLVRRLATRTVVPVARKGLTPADVPALSESTPPRAEEPVAATQAQFGLAKVCAPLYGIVHLTPSPDAAVFVQPGDSVQVGQTVCVIEAMKMFHEVRAEQPGRIAAVTVAAGDEVEAGTPLFLLEAMGDDV